MKRLLPIALLAATILGGAAIAVQPSFEYVPKVFKQGLTIGKTGTGIDDSYATSSTIDFASTSAQTCTDSSGITVTGAAVNDVCVVGPPAAGGATSGTFSCYVSAADTVKVRYCNPTSGSIDPASGTFAVRVIDP